MKLVSDGLDDEAIVERFEAGEDEPGEWWARVDERQHRRVIANARDAIETERRELVGLLLDGGVVAPRADAADQADDPIEALNRSYAVVCEHDGFRILHERPDGRRVYLTQHEFGLALAPFKLGSTPLARAWLVSPRRRAYPNGCVFDPSGRNPPGTLNTWPGFALEPDPEATCQRILDHLREVVCAGDGPLYDYVTGWMAHLVQRPEVKPGVALVPRG